MICDPVSVQPLYTWSSSQRSTMVTFETPWPPRIPRSSSSTVHSISQGTSTLLEASSEQPATRFVIPRLPSFGLRSDPGDALHLDVAAVRDAIENVAGSHGQDAVIVMHSYGGLAGTECYGMFREAYPVLQDAASSQIRRLVYPAAHGAVEKGAVFKPSAVQLPHLSIDVRRSGSLQLPPSKADPTTPDQGIATHIISSSVSTTATAPVKSPSRQSTCVRPWPSRPSRHRHNSPRGKTTARRALTPNA